MDMRSNIGRVKKKDPGVGENITHSFDESKWKKLDGSAAFCAFIFHIKVESRGEYLSEEIHYPPQTTTKIK